MGSGAEGEAARVCWLLAIVNVDVASLVGTRWLPQTAGTTAPHWQLRRQWKRQVMCCRTLILFPPQFAGRTANADSNRLA